MTWPNPWQIETVVMIPKFRGPEIALVKMQKPQLYSFCSKMLERFVFAMLTSSEGKIAREQYGDLHGVDHLLGDMWDTIWTDLLHPGWAASCVVSLDFEKAFKHMNHDFLIRQFAAMQNSGTSIRLQ